MSGRESPPLVNKKLSVYVKLLLKAELDLVHAVCEFNHDSKAALFECLGLNFYKMYSIL